MPAQRPRASFEPMRPDFDLNQLVESTPNFSYVDRISCEMIDQQGLPAFEKLVLLHVVIGGKPLVIDGFEARLDPWTFSPQWLRDNLGDKVENARNLTSKENLPLTMGHYLRNMGKLTNQFFKKGEPNAYKEKNRQRVYLKDIDCPDVWQDKLREQIPSTLFYLNDSTGDVGGPGAVPDPSNTAQGRRLGKGIARAGDLMSSLPPDMRAENLMCYIGHEGTYTPAHREMCASLGQNIMVEASSHVGDEGSTEKPGSSVWFMTESKDRHVVSEYWLSVLGHDIEVENHFAQVVAWKKAPFNVYVVEQRPGDFILIPPLAPHQVWNRGTRTIKVAWNRTTVETLDMALNEALPRSRIVCRDEQYKNKAIAYYTLQKYANLIVLAQQQASRLPADAAKQLLYSGKVKQLFKDLKRLFGVYKQIMLSEMFNPEDRDAPKSMEYLPFDGNVTCAYCRGNIFNRFLSCPSCKDVLGHSADEGEGDPYDVCTDCYAMGRSCGCISNLKWVEQFRWKELASKYESWRKLIISLEGGQQNDKTPLPLVEERRRLGKRTLAEVCKEQLKRRPWKDIHKVPEDRKEDEDEDEEIIVGDDGTVKKIAKKRSKAWLKNNANCHVCCKRHENWKMAFCTTCDRAWCYGSLFRGWDKMPIEIMEDPDWSCPHCLGICFAGACRKEGKMQPYEPKGTLLGHDTKKVADVRSVEALVDFSVSNLNWLKDDTAVDRTESSRVKRARAEAQKAKEADSNLGDDDEEAGVADETQVDYENALDDETPIDPALGDDGAVARVEGEDDDAYFLRRLQQANSTLPPPAAMVAGASAAAPLDGYAPVPAAGYVAATAQMYPQPGTSTYAYPEYARPASVEAMNREEEEVDGLRPFKRRHNPNDDEDEDISMLKAPKVKKPRMSAAGFRSTDLADETLAAKAKNEAQRQFEREKERKALDKAKSDGRFIMLQAALRGKKRIVSLPLPGARLAQLLAQQAAKAALRVGEEVDAEHEVEEGASQSDQEGDGDALLKSDIAPKKKPDPKKYYEKRQKDGLVVTGKTKKALIPIEKDESYGSRIRERLPNGKRVMVEKKKKSRESAVDYEEVDIGSDEDMDEDHFVSQETGAVRDKDRRSLPGYLRNRHADAEGLPSELSDSVIRERQQIQKAPGTSSARHLSHHTESGSKRGVSGKRPNMRPAQAILDDAGDEEVDETINQAADGDFMDVDDAVQPSITASSRAAVSDAHAPSLHAQPDSAEQNRLAKLQALAMVDGGEVSESRGHSRGQPTSTGRSKGAPMTVSMADALTPPEDSDDGVDSVPATRLPIGKLR